MRVGKIGKNIIGDARAVMILRETAKTQSQNIYPVHRCSVKKAIFIFVLFLFVSFPYSQQIHQERSLEKDELVILLHGLARSQRSMEKIEKALTSDGYKVINLEYPSNKQTIEVLANTVLDTAIQQSKAISQSKIHFITHSMGGIVVRYYLKLHKLPNLGRVVMISPPNKGTELADNMVDIPFLRKIIGPAGKQLGTDKNSLPQRLGPVDFELGVIAGNKSINPFYSMMLPGPDDGVVPVARTKVEGMSDFLVLPHTHPFITQSKDVIEQVIFFLEYGRFKHSVNEEIEEDRFNLLYEPKYIQMQSTELYSETLVLSLI